ncbi:MAG TPA: S41 family peptidase [Thermoanaerobaculia bacterium]|jgi:C-terminal processing protease CtpA/Prc
MKINKSAGILLWVVLSLLGTAPSQAAQGNEPPRQLTARKLENLTAFTRLLGYVRFFHPSDQAFVADWSQVAIAGVQEAEKAVNPVDLARTLEDLFRPLAPTVRVFPDGDRPDLPAELAPPAGVANPEVIYWEHAGVGLPGGTIPTYSSRRSTFPGAPPAETGLPRPGQPLEVSLGGGVSALVPLSLYRDADGTLPHVSARPPTPDKPAGFVPSGNDRATRLADVALAWTVFQHFYPYFDVVQADWPGELQKALSSAAKDRNERAFVDTLRRLMAALDDGHAKVTHPSWVLTHQLPLAWDWIEDRLVVTYADPRGAPGLARGDVVLSLNGKPAGQVLAAEEALAPGATPQHIRWRALQALLMGPPNEVVRLKVQRARGGTANVALRRSLPIVDGRTLGEPRPEKIVEIRPGVFYVDIDRITDEDFEAALGQLAAARGIVFDLRGYPWNVSAIVLEHLTGATIRSALFQVPLVHLPDRQGFRFQDRGWPLAPASPRLTGRIAFLTDGRAVSYAETYMGIVENYRLAEIVGEATAGTNGTINPFPLPGGYVLRWTGMRVLKHDGSQHHGVGIQPTVPISRTLKGVIEGRDELLERAIEVVNQ